MEIFIFWAVMGIVVAIIASSKGFNRLLWFMYGLVIWPIALVHVLVAKKTDGAVVEERSREGRVRCDSCAEWIYSQAKMCPHCKNERVPT